MEIYFIRKNYSTFTTMYRADTKWVVVTLFWCLFILFLSLYESNKINEFVHFRHQDKLAHLGMYAGLSICLNKLFSQLISPKRKWIFIFCIAFIIGGSLEILQGQLTQTRVPSIYDQLFNLIGFMCAYFYAFFRKQ